MPDEDDRTDEPADYPQQQREWGGAWWSVIFPLLLVAAVALGVWAYFTWSL